MITNAGRTDSSLSYLLLWGQKYPSALWFGSGFIDKKMTMWGYCNENHCFLHEHSNEKKTLYEDIFVGRRVVI